LGRSIKGATLYCTTFPCHNCTKHLLAAGIRRVVYIEPYPKSKVTDLHPDEVAVEADVPGKVAFVPFLGISPYRYRDIFQKGKRKNQDGTARTWYARDNKESPLVDAALPAYFEAELASLGMLTGDVVEARPK
jgi:cytidine deaminase